MTNRKELILLHKNLADALAKNTHKRTRFSNVYLEELQAAAYLGLVDAANRYKEDVGEFKTFAYPRIQGSINSYLRDIGGYRRLVDKRRSVQMVPLADIEISYMNDSDIDCNLLLSPLSSRGKNLLKWYYLDELDLDEVAAKAGVSRSAIHNLLNYYRRRVREAWHGKEDEFVSSSHGNAVIFKGND